MSFELIQAINRVVEAGTRDLKLRVPESEPGEYISPNIFIGAVPPKRKGNAPGQDDKSAFPFIINRIISGEDTDAGSIINLHTICGIYTASNVEAGEHDIINLTMRVKRLLMVQQILEKRFIREGAVKWHMGDIEDRYLQATPFFGGVIKTTWSVPAYEKLLTFEQEKEVYGEV